MEDVPRKICPCTPPCVDDPGEERVAGPRLDRRPMGNAIRGPCTLTRGRNSPAPALGTPRSPRGATRSCRGSGGGYSSVPGVGYETDERAALARGLVGVRG